MSLISTFSSLSIRAWQSLQQAIFSKIQIISPALSANEFGSSVEQSGDSNYAVIGAANANKVFMFSRSNDTYTEQTSFTGSTSAQLGTSCDMNYDGTYAIVDNKGRERYGIDGSPLTINGLVNEVAQGNPKLLRQSSGNSGSGLRPGQGSFAGALEEGIPDYTRDPAAFNAWAARNGLGKNVGLKGMRVTASSAAPSRKIL